MSLAATGSLQGKHVSFDPLAVEHVSGCKRPRVTVNVAFGLPRSKPEDAALSHSFSLGGRARLCRLRSCSVACRCIPLLQIEATIATRNRLDLVCRRVQATALIPNNNYC